MVAPSSGGDATRPASSYAVPEDGSTPVPAWEPPPSIDRRLAGANADSVRLALRVVVQLDRLGPPGPDGTARPDATQGGLAGALGVTQGAVSKVLTRLAAVSMVVSELRHVRGRDRRVWVYHLSREGEGLAREIEQRFGLPSPPRPPGS
jgi:hypothetical protein